MTDTEQRFALSMRQADDDEPGLIRERDGTVWLVNPDGTRTQLPGSGSGVPDGGSIGEVLTKTSNADGDADWEASGGSQPVLHKVTVGFAAFTNRLGDGDGYAHLLTVPAGAWVRCLRWVITQTFNDTAAAQLPQVVDDGNNINVGSNSGGNQLSHASETGAAVYDTGGNVVGAISPSAQPFWAYVAAWGFNGNTGSADFYMLVTPLS